MNETPDNTTRRSDPARRFITILLALAGIGTMIAYLACETACSYLQGEILGIDLKVVGIAFMIAVGALAWLKQGAVLRSILAAALGGEVFLLWFQFQEDVFCPYCLAFMACLIAAFAVNHERPKMKGWKRIFYIPGEVRFSENSGPHPLILFMLAGFGLMVLMFSGSTLPVYAADQGIRVYGGGETEIRIYTDYFCGPCRSAEKRTEPLMEEIVRTKKARILFIDTPIHKETILYGRYYLFALEAADDDLRTALKIRRALFEAAEKEIKTRSGLEAFLKSRQIPFNASDANPVVFKQYNDYIRADQIKSTPTIVVVTASGKGAHAGADEIVKALKEIKKGAYRATAP